MQAVIDTNVLISGLLWHSTPHALLEQVRNGTVTQISSPALLAELARVIDRPKFDVIFLRTNTSRAQALAEVRQLAEVIDRPPLAQPVCRDKDDDVVLALALALALAAQADMVISGDDDLLCLHPFEEIPVLTPAQALQRVLESL